MNRKEILVKFAAVILGTLIFAACAGWNGPKGTLPTSAKPFTAAKLGSGTFEFNPKTIQKPTVLIFWASWCPPCQREMPALAEIYEKNSDHLDLLGINVDREQSSARRFVAEKKIPFENLSDPQAKIADQFSVDGTPTIFVLDRQGVIRYRGHHLGKEFRAKLQEVVDDHGTRHL